MPLPPRPRFSRYQGKYWLFLRFHAISSSMETEHPSRPFLPPPPPPCSRPSPTPRDLPCPPLLPARWRAKNVRQARRLSVAIESCEAFPPPRGGCRPAGGMSVGCVCLENGKGGGGSTAGCRWERLSLHRQRMGMPSFTVRAMWGFSRRPPAVLLPSRPWH